MTQIIYFNKTECNVKRHYLAADINKTIGDDIVTTGNKINTIGRFRIAAGGNCGAVALIQLFRDWFDNNYLEESIVEESHFPEFFESESDKIRSLFSDDESFINILLIDTRSGGDVFDLEVSNKGIVPERVDTFRLIGCASQAAGVLTRLLMESPVEVSRKSFESIFRTIHKVVPIISEDFTYCEWESRIDG